MAVELIVFTDALVYSSLLTLMTVGLTLTYLTTKVPNFAHGTLATLGIYVALVVSKLFGLNVYYGLIPSFIVGGAAAVLQYIAILKPLTKRNASITILMVATIAFELLLLSGLNIFADYLSKQFHILSTFFQLTSLDFSIIGERGVIIVSPILVVGTVISLYLLLMKTKFGIAMRATIENPSLAGTVGINTNLVYTISWFIAGGTAGLAGALLPLWFIGNTDTGSVLLISIFAAAVAGGLFNIYGAVIGGYLVGVAEIVLIRVLALAPEPFGAWVIPYRPIIPLIAMVITLLIAPSGITGIDLQKLRKRIGRGKGAQ
jgi:branched-chain amino acid transport system permease protein